MTLSTLYFETPAGLSGGQPICNIIPLSYLFRLRRIIIGVRNNGGAPANQLLTVALTPASSRGVPVTTLTFSGHDPFAVANPASITADVAWSTLPTFSTAVDQQIYGFPVSHTGPDISWNQEEAVVVYPIGSGLHGLVLWNVESTLATDHFYTVTLQVEE